MNRLIRAAPESPWIPVSKRLPGLVSVIVAVKLEQGYIFKEGYYVSGEWYVHGLAHPNITHWMGWDSLEPPEE